ncbi:hypothetical protein ACFC1R_34925 [Kitasatospora sp. NPDC056138]|uniref:hypothetical protein n=1 Tax=Kitasatospora sp. NPDC056138 TaxID=3345724 RepID=UPI0035DA75DE
MPAEALIGIAVTTDADSWTPSTGRALQGDLPPAVLDRLTSVHRESMAECASATS